MRVARPSPRADVGLAESDGVGVAGTAITAESFICHFCDVRAAHYNRYADGANRIGHAIGFGDHASHGANADQINFLFDDITRNASFVHGLGVTVDQHNFMARRG